MMVVIAALVGREAPFAARVAGAAATPQPATPVAAGLTVASRDIYFEPDGLAIPADADVSLLLPNDGKALHSFTIDALGVDVYVAPGAEERVVIHAAPGTYRFYCAVYGHAAAGMVGELTVK